jgi:nucleoside phosphorylase
VCALPVELAAAKVMLDEKHEDAIRDIGDDDQNVYCMGSVAGHDVVIVCLPGGRIGNYPATTVATQLRAAFKGIRFGLMVGIGGGVPSAGADIRLGDVLVSQPQGSFGGVVQYDFGRTTPNGLERIGSLNSPPQILLSALNTTQANAMLGESTLSEHLSRLERIPIFQRRRAGPDLLFKAAYNHEHGATCDQCSVESQQLRPERDSGAEVMVHYGTIASGNQVMKDATERDRISAELGDVLCFEMEAAGLMNSFPCFVIRGICDYADTHKNSRWQAYAAGAAAAYVKELLEVIPALEVMNIPRAEDAMNRASSQFISGIAIKAASKAPLQKAILAKAPAASTNTLTDIVASRLGDFFANGDQRQAAYTDLEILQVSLLLGQVNLQWSKVPRTYIVLRTIGCLDLLDTFIDLGFSDH